MDNKLRVAIAVSQNYYTILDRRKRYARHIDTLNATKPDIEMTEIPMAPRLVAYQKKSEAYRKSQKKLDDECIAMLRKSYKEREMARRHQRRPGTTRDWVAELGTIRAGKKATPTNSFGSKQPQLRPLQSQRTYRTPAAAKIIFPDDNEQITAGELYEPTGLEDGMQVTDQGPASARSQRSNNYVTFGQYMVTPPNQPRSARGNYRNSGTIKEPSNDSSSRSKRKVLASQTQTEPESQEYESDVLGENENQVAQNKVSTLGDTFESINSLANTGKKNSESEKESFDNTDSDHDKDKSDKENESEKEDENEKDKDDENEKDKSEDNDSEKENKKSDENDDEEKDKDLSEDFESTAKSDLNSTAKSDMNSTMKSDFDETDSKDESENKDEDESDNKDDKDSDDDDDDDDNKEKSEDDDDDDKKDDDDEDKSEDKKDDEEKEDDDDDFENSSNDDPFAD